MTLGHFEAGSGWEAQLRHYVRKKYSQDLAGLLELDPEPLARLLRGEILAGRPYASIRWVLRLTPFRPLELFFLLDHDEEFGADLRIFYARKSLVIPTEDAYVFAWDHLALLARYGRGEFSLAEAAPGHAWLPFSDIAPDVGGPMESVSLGAREELLRLLTPDLVKVALRRMDCGSLAETAGGWAVIWPVLGDLAYRLTVSGADIDMAFDSHGGRKYAPALLMSFTWLYINALLRECRQVDSSLPRLSRYF